MNLLLVPMCECRHERKFHFDNGGPCFQCAASPVRCPLYVPAAVKVVTA